MMINLQAHNKLSILMEIIQKYKREQKKPVTIADQVFHIHERNPDTSLQIRFLEMSLEFIKTYLDESVWEKAQLAVLLVLKALLTDPNSDGEIFEYLAEKLELDKAINAALKKVKPGVQMALRDPHYLEVSKDEFEFCKLIIEQAHLKVSLPKNFMKDLLGTIDTELDYIQRVINTLRLSFKP